MKSKKTGRKLLVATHNPAKRAEIKKFLKGFNFQIVDLAEAGITVDIEEDGRTFEENAVKKARFYGEKSGLLTLADDGGLEIDSLNGGPGVHSRRWINGRWADDETIIKYALKLLKNLPVEKRQGQLRTVVAIFDPQKQTLKTGSGKVRGIISLKPHPGRWKGFPFRSLFYLPAIKKFYNPEELTDAEEEKYNHRRQAIEEALNDYQNNQ